MKKLFYFHLKNIDLIICIIGALLCFLLLHLYSGNFSGTCKEIINGIADGVVLAMLLSFVGSIKNNYHHLNELKRFKESVNVVLIISLLKYVYGNKILPDISRVSIKEICERIIENIDDYKEEEFMQFQYAIRNDYDAIIHNINVVAKIGNMHSFIYTGLISNLKALLEEWKDFEEKFKKYRGDHPIYNKEKYYNMYFQSKGHIRTYIKTCIKFDECEFEDFSAIYN